MCLDEAEECISTGEDTVITVNTMTKKLEKHVAYLTSKINLLVNHHTRSNLRLVNLPEKVENCDAVAILKRRGLRQLSGPPCALKERIAFQLLQA